MAHVYHWKHGWIPLDHTAALSKAKGDRKAAARLEAVHPKHLPRAKHVTAGHRNGRIALHDTKTGHTAAMSATHAKGLHDSGRIITGVKAGGAVDHHSRLSQHLAERPLSEGELKDLLHGDGSAAAHLVKGPDGKHRFTPERAALHAKIIEDTLKGANSQEHPRYNVMGGGPASGKSTMEKATPELADNAALVNADEYKLALPEYHQKSVQEAASHAHEESSYLVARATEEAFNRKVNVTLDGTGDSSAEKLGAKIESARAAGYSVHGHYVTVPTDIAVDRSMKRAARSGRLVPERTIRDTHRSVSAVLPQALDKFDSVALWDNTGTSLAKVLEKKPGGKAKVLDEGLWKAFVAKAHE